MKQEQLFLILIGVSFAGFMTGLVAKNSFHQKKKTLRMEAFFKYLTAVSIIALLILAFLYSILYS